MSNDSQAQDEWAPDGQTTYKEAYDVLSRNAELLRESKEPDIDNLLRLVNESMRAHELCKKRLDAVDEALRKAFAAAGAEGSAERAERSPAPEAPKKPGARAPAPEPSDDDDVPF